MIKFANMCFIGALSMVLRYRIMQRSYISSYWVQYWRTCFIVVLYTRIL